MVKSSISIKTEHVTVLLLPRCSSLSLTLRSVRSSPEQKRPKQAFQRQHAASATAAWASRPARSRTEEALLLVPKDYRSQMAFSPIVTVKVILTAGQGRWSRAAAAAHPIYKPKQENLWGVHRRIGALNFSLIPTPSPIEENHKSHASVMLSAAPFSFLSPGGHLSCD